MNYYLGIDIGTTSAKSVAFSEKGEVIGDFSFPYDMLHPKQGWCEQDPNTIFKAVIAGINKAIQTFSPDLPHFVAFSAAMHSLIAVGEDGSLLTNCIIWADNRSNAIASDLRESEVGQKFYHASGVPIHSMSPLCKLLWLRQFQPIVFNRAYKFIGIKEYIFYKLFGEFIVDTSIASATGLLNIKTLQWDEEILKYVGLTSSRLSTIVSTKHIIQYADGTNDLLFGRKIPFVIGASDGALSNLGAGATASNTMAITIGTSGAARTVISAPKTDSGMRTFCYHLKDNLFVAGGGSNNGAVVLQWLKESILQTTDDYDELFKQAEKISVGSNDLLFLPYILGERAPIWNGNAKGVFFGLNIQHTKAHLIRSALEAVIFSVYSIAKILAEQFKVTELHASGGFAKSALWLQMLADVSNIKVLVSDTVESSALGAVMLGTEALEMGANFQKNILAMYSPNSQNHDIYKKQFAKFERLYDLLKQEMNPDNPVNE